MKGVDYLMLVLSWLVGLVVSMNVTAASTFITPHGTRIVSDIH